MWPDPLGLLAGEIERAAYDDIRVESVSPTGELVLRWPGGAVLLEVPVALVRYYKRLVRGDDR